MAIHGTHEPEFVEVLAEFERNFAEHGEVGAAVTVTVDGQTVVDLWGGVTDPETGTEWTEDTLVEDGVLVRQLLDHPAGLCGVRAPLPDGAFYDWDTMTGILAADEPLWPPGATHGYHGLTFGRWSWSSGSACPNPRSTGSRPTSHPI